MKLLNQVRNHNSVCSTRPTLCNMENNMSLNPVKSTGDLTSRPEKSSNNNLVITDLLINSLVFIYLE